MRASVVVALMFVIASPAIGAQSYTLPLSVVPGTARIGVSTQPDTPVAFPFSEFMQSSTCTAAGTFSAEVINGGLEVQFSGSAFAPSGGGSCQMRAQSVLQVEIHATELGGTATHVRLESTPMIGDFSSLAAAEARIGRGDDDATSSSVPGEFGIEFDAWHQWDQVAGLRPRIGVTRPVPLVPGDTVRIPIDLEFIVTGNPGTPTQGTFRVRYEFKVTVPEPSASLSLPLGAGALMALARMRVGA